MMNQEIREEKDVLVAFRDFTASWLMVDTWGQCKLHPLNLTMQDGSCCFSRIQLDFSFSLQFIMVAEQDPSLISRRLNCCQGGWGRGF